MNIKSWSKQNWLWLVIVALLILAPATIQADGNPNTPAVLTWEVGVVNSCQWNVYIRGTNFTPNTAVFASITPISAQGCNGQPSIGLANTHIGTADGNGNIAYLFPRTDYGIFTYNWVDAAGKSASAQVQYSNVQPPTQVMTPIPTWIFATPVPTATYTFPPTVIAPTPDVYNCGGYPIRLGVGQTGKVSDYDYASMPGYAQATDLSARVVSIQVRGYVEIIQGPYCDGTWVWWQINHNEILAWVKEVNRDGCDRWLYRIEDVLPGYRADYGIWWPTWEHQPLTGGSRQCVQ